MTLQDTVAFSGNLANILTLVGGALIMGLPMLRRQRRPQAEALPEVVKAELAAQEAVARLRYSAYLTSRAMVAAAREALQEQAERESP